MQYKSVKRAIRRGHLEVNVQPIPANNEYAKITLWRRVGRNKPSVFYSDFGIAQNKLDNDK